MVASVLKVGWGGDGEDSGEAPGRGADNHVVLAQMGRIEQLELLVAKLAARAQDPYKVAVGFAMLSLF